MESCPMDLILFSALNRCAVLAAVLKDDFMFLNVLRFRAWQHLH